MSATLYRVVLPVADIERAAYFYSEVFGEPGERVSPGRHHFDCGGTVLACFDPRADGDDFDAEAHQGTLYFAVEDLEVVFERVRRAGCEAVDDEIETQPWGERSFHAADPFGNPICFVDEETVFVGYHLDEPG